MVARRKAPLWRLGVDTGGTFTDFILIEGDRRGGRGGRARVLKVLSTPENPARAILEGVAQLLGEMPEAGTPGARAPWGPLAGILEITHGSTVATNALLTRTGARTGLLTTAGLEDVVEIGRQNRSRLYDLYYRRPPPLVPRPLRLGVPERVGPEGEVERPLDQGALERALARLGRAGVGSVAISFLHSYANPDHERRAAEAARRAGFAVSPSSRILPEYREYERTSTTCVNAYVSPLMGRYLSELDRRLPGGRLRVMQSNGGVLSARAAGQEAVRTILSGPAGGVVGGFAAARAAGFTQAITFDMGGTSTDVSLCRGDVGFTAEAEVAGCPIRVPVIDIHTVGAGGGSLAWRDAGGALRVGPQSAGADPGPICYGRARSGRVDLGQEVTVTDAHLFLGRLDAARFLGGGLRLDLRGVEEGLARLGRALGLEPREAAEGVLRVADASMERAIRLISVERGHDPREFVLVAFGGAG
ncbi:MAG: hydantoinase/oxoprolinase family protein, partial [Nitrospinota bacterium]